MPDECFVGIDISKEGLDVHLLPGGENFTITRDSKAITSLVKKLKKKTVTIIVVEATGGYEIPVSADLAAAGLPVAVVNPRQVRNFARGLGKLAKTDRIDAYILARFGETVQPQPRPLPTEQERAIKELVLRRRQLLATRTAEKNRLSRASSERVKRSIVAIIEAIDQQIREVERDLDDTIKNSPVLARKR